MLRDHRESKRQTGRLANCRGTLRLSGKWSLKGFVQGPKPAAEHAPRAEVFTDRGKKETAPARLAEHVFMRGSAAWPVLNHGLAGGPGAGGEGWEGGHLALARLTQQRNLHRDPVAGRFLRG